MVFGHGNAPQNRVAVDTAGTGTAVPATVLMLAGVEAGVKVSRQD
jgi:hypothetical protein